MNDQAAADNKTPRRVRTTTEKMIDLRDTVRANVDKLAAKENRLQNELRTIHAARKAGEEELQRIDQTLPPDLRLGAGMQVPDAQETRAQAVYDRANGVAE